MIHRKISVLISKKLSVNWNSASVSYGVSSDLEAGEDYQMAIRKLRKEVTDLVNEGLTPQDKLRVVQNI